MIEVLTTGLYAREPHFIGGAGVLMRTQGAVSDEVMRSFHGREVRSKWAAEPAAMTLALERLLDGGWGGGDVLIRTAMGNPLPLEHRRRRSLPENVRYWIKRLQRMETDFHRVRTVRCPGAIVEPAETRVLRAILDRALEHGGE